MWLLEQSLELVSVFQEASRNLHIYFSLEQDRLKIKESFAQML
jgi:hypothetical protein